MYFILFTVLVSRVYSSDQVVEPESSELPTQNVIKYKRIELEHSFGNNEFIARTELFLHQKSKSKIESSIESPSDGVNGVAEADLVKFKGLLQSNGLYRIRVHSNPGNNSSPFVMAALPACELQRSGFKEEIIIHFDEFENIISLEYSSPVIALPRPCDAKKITAEIKFQTKVKVAETQIAQAVPLHPPGQRPPYLGDVKLDTEDEKAKPQQKSFFAQYWHFIVPVALVMFMSPDEKKTGGAAAKDQKQGEAATSAAPARNVPAAPAASKGRK